MISDDGASKSGATDHHTSCIDYLTCRQLIDNQCSSLVHEFWKVAPRSPCTGGTCRTASGWSEVPDGGLAFYPFRFIRSAISGQSCMAGCTLIWGQFHASPLHVIASGAAHKLANQPPTQTGPEGPVCVWPVQMTGGGEMPLTITSTLCRYRALPAVLSPTLSSCL